MVELISPCTNVIEITLLQSDHKQQCGIRKLLHADITHVNHSQILHTIGLHK